MAKARRSKKIFPQIKARMLQWEKRAFLRGASLIIGVDEAGRGPLAGPVVAAAVMLRPSSARRFIFPRFRERIDDSKKISPSQREKAFKEISKKAFYGLGLKSHSFIDRKNIHNATLAAMRQSVYSLIREYCRKGNKKERQIKNKICVLVDGRSKPGLPFNTVSIIGGDSKSLSIAAASIVAKVTRDRIMDSYDKKYPEYGFLKHKGYGTRRHMEALDKYGPSPIHRMSFAPLNCNDSR